MDHRLVTQIYRYLRKPTKTQIAVPISLCHIIMETTKIHQVASNYFVVQKVGILKSKNGKCTNLLSVDLYILNNRKYQYL